MGIAVAPALLVWFIRRHVPEPAEITETIAARRTRRERGQAVDQDRFVLRRLLSPPLLHRTLVGTALATGSLIAFWSVSTWYPQIIRLSAAADMMSIDDGNHRVAIASMLFNAGGIAGYASWGFIADAIGRRKAFALSFIVSAISVAYLFPFERSYTEFLIAMPVIGFGLFGALSGTFVYGPEIFPPSVRATGMALANSVGRYITAAGPLIAGIIAASWFGGDLGLATTCVAAFGLIALVGLAFAPETKGAALPTDSLGAADTPPTPATTGTRPAEAVTTSEESHS
jgi:MFS family permease